jgi:hypothetical protein
MKYEAFPSIGTKTNKLVVYSPDESYNEYYDTLFPKLEPVSGPIEASQFNQSNKVILPPSREWEFDACTKFSDYRRSSYRGRRRTHAYHLAANYRKLPVVVFEKWLNQEAQDGFNEILNLLTAIVQGVRCSFSDRDIIWYQMNETLHIRLCEFLDRIKERTEQLNPNRIADVPKIPNFITGNNTPLYNATFMKNDWEILVATYRAEVETFLQASLYFGYDYQPVDLEESLEQEEEEELLEEDSQAPPPLSPEVLSLITSSIFRNSKGKSSVHFEDQSAPPTPTPPQVSSSRFPMSSTPRGPSVAKLKEVFEDPSYLELPPTPARVSPLKPSSPSNPFAPVDPITRESVVPTYQEEQINRVYGAPAPDIQEELGTDRYREMFKPSIYASNDSQVESPGAARAISEIPATIPSYGQNPTPSVSFNYSQMSTGGATGFGQNPASRITILSRDPGNNNFPPGPPHGPPGPPHGPPGPPHGPPGPPFGPPNPGHSFGPNNPYGYNSPNAPPGGGPPGPPGPPAGGATDAFGNPRNNSILLSGVNKWVNTRETHFDTKLKPDIIPTWDGDETTLGRWILQINELAHRSASIFKGLGDVVPTRFRDKAATWWYSLTDGHRLSVTTNWDTLKEEIRTYWMNQAWVERTQRKAIRAKYREPGHTNESPTEYYIRKLELLSMVYNFTPSQIMSEVLRKAPRLWSTVLNARSFANLAQFQTAIKYHEELLIELGEKYEKVHRQQSRSYRVDTQTRKVSSKSFKSNRTKDSKPKQVRTYAVGWSNPQKPPPHPKDDSNVSKGKTPADYGARGCIFCGSTNHWDKECKYNKGNALRKARTYFVDYTPDDFHAEAEYDRCYLESIDSEPEHSDESDVSENSDEEPETPEISEDSNNSDF